MYYEKNVKSFIVRKGEAARIENPLSLWG